MCIFEKICYNVGKRGPQRSVELRNSFTKSNNVAKFSSYSSLSSIYISMALVNVQTHRYHIVKTLDEFAVFIPGMLDKERAETFFDRLFSNIEHSATIFDAKQ